MAKKKKETPEEQIQNVMASIVIDGEYAIAKRNQNDDNLDFESLVDMLEGKRNEKNYEWMSDYSIPELISILQTNASGWASQYFPTRDFVEVKLDGDSPQDIDKARATKKLINKVLNRRDLYYYQKYIRLRLINALHGRCYVLCWWEQELVPEKVMVQRPKQLDVDIYGNSITDPTVQQPRIIMDSVEIEIEKPAVDRFCFEVIDPRNIFMDSKYCYTTQEKDWVIIRSEASYGYLKNYEKKNNYFNLDKIKEAVKSRNTTDTKKETYGKDDNATEFDKTPIGYFDVLDRYGKFWAIVEERDIKGNPTKASTGIDQDGMPLDDAELIETIISYALIGSHRIMYRFTPTPNIDASGKPFKPIARGICYVHPVKDTGLSDGRNMSELQTAIDDNFNMGVDRVKLATMPTFIGRKGALEDNSQFYMEPEHLIETENPQTDFLELKVSDNIQGAMLVHQMLTGKIQQVTATYPTTMGDQGKSSTTATAVAGAETRTNQRENYKSLTFEYTFLTEFYWIINQMGWRFAHDETLIKIMGEDARFFDANADYSYSPLSSNIEQEYNKYRKIQLYDQSIGRISGLVQPLPEVVPILAHMIGRQLELQGDEFQTIGAMIGKLAKAKVRPDGGTPAQITDGQEPPMSNQNGVEMSTQEGSVRSAQMAGGMIQ
jgi:hypothetical protein